MNKLILIDKKENVTSYDVVAKVKRIFHTRKVGHCGTLDPFASGLLIIGINQATKVMNFLESDYKEYEAIIKLGSSTDTLDTEGKVISESKITPFDIKKLNEVLNLFKGEITQTPPIYSSIHVDGKKLYEYARNNKEVTIPTRKVFIYDLKLLEYDSENIKIYVKCSKGTYIRTLGHDIAKSLNNDGHLCYLRRLSIGNILVDNANSYEDLLNNNLKVYDIKEVLNYKPLYINDTKILKRVYNGQDIILKNETEDKVIICDDTKEIAIYERSKDVFFHCIRGLFDEDSRIERLRSL